MIAVCFVVAVICAGAWFAWELHTAPDEPEVTADVPVPAHMEIRHTDTSKMAWNELWRTDEVEIGQGLEEKGP